MFLLKKTIFFHRKHLFSEKNPIGLAMVPIFHKITSMVEAEWVEVVVVDIVFSNEAASLIMKNTVDGKNFVIHVAPETGTLLLDIFQKRTQKRPNTFTLLSNCITALGAHIQSIVIGDSFEGIFFAKIVLKHRGTFISLDARPSDAIALAFINHFPILATANLLRKLPWIDHIPSPTQAVGTFFLCH
jgi:bifunctional DNase/RNase